MKGRDNKDEGRVVTLTFGDGKIVFNYFLDERQSTAVKV